MNRFSKLYGPLLFFKSNYHVKSSLKMLKKAGYFENILPQHSDKHFCGIEESGSLKMYCGFDPTADSLQLGNLVAIIGLLRAQSAGHNTIALIGEATSSIGDPTGKVEARVTMPLEVCANYSSNFKEALQTIQRNFQEQILPHFREYKNPGNFEIMNNMEWLQDANLLRFISESASYVRLQELVHKDSVKLRESIGMGMSMKEFLYPLLQAYDFLHLHQNHDCCIQLGGNDQVGNIDTGIALIRRKLGKSVFGLTVPLLVASDGSKIGKTTSKHQNDIIWLSQKKLRPFLFFQRLLNQSDQLMTQRFLQQLTFFSTDEIQQILAEHLKCPAKRIAQRSLAQEITLLVHGASSLQASELASRILYASSSSPSETRAPMHALADGLSLSERNFLVACCVYPNAPLDSPLPVVHEAAVDQSSSSSLTRIHEVLKMLMDSKQDFGSQIWLDRGVVLNGVQILKPGDVPAKQKQCTCSERKCLRSYFENSENVLNKAWKACDPATGISILQMGKRASWFVVPFEKIREC